jgi:hypothetical protein
VEWEEGDGCCCFLTIIWEERGRERKRGEVCVITNVFDDFNYEIGIMQ